MDIPESSTVPDTPRRPVRSTTGVRGVRVHSTGRYEVRIRIGNRRYSLGMYDNLDDAAAMAAKGYAGDLPLWLYPTTRRGTRRRYEGQPTDAELVRKYNLTR